MLSIQGRPGGSDPALQWALTCFHPTGRKTRKFHHNNLRKRQIGKTSETSSANSFASMGSLWRVDPPGFSCWAGPKPFLWHRNPTRKGSTSLSCFLLTTSARSLIGTRVVTVYYEIYRHESTCLLVAMETSSLSRRLALLTACICNHVSAPDGG